MSRYVDVDALKEYIGNARAEFNFFDDDERARYEAHSKGIYLLDLYVDDAPSIDIVRCKECKYFIDNLTEDDTDEVYGQCCFDWDIKMPKANDYCSYGEREGE